MKIISSTKAIIVWCSIHLSILGGALSFSDGKPLLPHKRFVLDEDTSTNNGLETKDKEELQEAIQLLNMGKQSLNLPTEDTQLLIQLVDAPNTTDRSDQVQKFVEESFDDEATGNEKQYMALSGDEGQVNVNNYSVVTPAPDEGSVKKSGDVEDVFKMVVKKKMPGAKEHKITIIETNKIKALTEPPKTERKRSMWSASKPFNVPLSRQKRVKTNEDALMVFLKGEFPENDVDYLFPEKGSHKVHSFKNRDLFEDNQSVRIDNEKDKFSYSDYDRGSKSQFKGTYSPWIRPSKRDHSSYLNRNVGFHKKRDANNYKKKRISGSYSKSYWSSSKFKPEKDVDNEFPTKNDRDTETIFESRVYDPYDPWVFDSQAYPRVESVRSSLSKRSHLQQEKSTTDSMHDTISESPTTENSATVKYETTVHNLNLTKVQQTDINGSSPSQNPSTFPSNPNRNLREAITPSTFQATTILFICLLCIFTIVLACSIAYQRNPPTNTLDLEGARVIFNVRSVNDPRRLGGQLHQYKSHSGTIYRKVADDEVLDDEVDLPELEWQSEGGEWIYDQGNARNVITFEKMSV